MELASHVAWFVLDDNLVIFAPLTKLNDAEFDAIDALLGEEWARAVKRGTLAVKGSVRHGKES